jgi:hypothetical protein
MTSVSRVVAIFTILSAGIHLLSAQEKRTEDTQASDSQILTDEPVELVQRDLFGTRDWQHKGLSINGFKLGLNRTDVLQIAKTKHLTLLTTNPRTVGETNGPCRQDEFLCKVYEDDGPWIGMTLFFDTGSQLNKITVSVPADAIPEVKRVNVARTFKGQTYQFFNHYSDNLRRQILGTAEAKKLPGKGGSTVFPNLEYDYSRWGLIVRVTIDSRDNPPKPFDLEVDFAHKNNSTSIRH